MRTSTALIGLPSLIFIIAGATPLACSSSNGGATTSDAGSDAGTDTGTDVSTTDGGTDSAPTCDKHLPSGFTNVIAPPAADPNPDTYGVDVAFALDEHDDPMFAYYSGFSTTVLEFTRWDPCAGAFTPVIDVDSAVGSGAVADVSHGGRDIGIAYDLTTHEIGIVYLRVLLNSNGTPLNIAAMLASKKATDAKFTIQQVSTGEDTTGGGLVSYPAIAMGGGMIYLAYAEGSYRCYRNPATMSSCDGEWLLTSSSTPPDGGAPGDGGTPEHYFDPVIVPYQGAPAQPLGLNFANAVAIDSSGRVGVAFYQNDFMNSSNLQMMYWRSDTASAVVVTDSAGNGQGNYGPDLTLLFEGTKPRIGGEFVAAAALGSYNLTFEASDDGVTWAAPVHLPLDNGSTPGSLSSLAMDGAGNGAIVAPSGNSAASCLPQVASTTNDGTSWTLCTPNVGHKFNSAAYTNALYGAARIKGKLILSFVNEDGTNPPTQPAGVYYYQAP